MRLAWHWIIGLCVFPLSAAAQDWHLSSLRYRYGPIPELTLTSARPIASFGDASLIGILTSEPPLPWECLIRSERELHCQVDYEQPPIALATPLKLTLEGDRLLDQQGAALAGIKLTVPTPQPFLRVALDNVKNDPQVLRVIAPMALDPDSIVKSLKATIDDVAVNYELTDTGPKKGLDFNSQNWPAVSYREANPPQYIWWYAPTTHAWDLRLDRLPLPGQRLEFRLFPGLLSEQGPLSNRVLSDSGDSLLQFDVPESLVVSAHCSLSSNPDTSTFSAPIATDCSAEGSLQLHFDSTPSPSTLAAVLAALPTDLQIATEAPALVAMSAGYSHEFPLVVLSPPLLVYLRGAGAEKDYGLEVQSDWTGIFGQAARSTTIGWRTLAWPPTTGFAPGRVALRRHETALPELYARGYESLGAAISWTGLDGSKSQREFTLRADQRSSKWGHRGLASVEVPLPTDRPMWAVGTNHIPWPEEYLSWSPQQQASYDPIVRHKHQVVVAVTDLGLHAIRSSDRLLAVVTDLDTALPVRNARVRVRAGKQILAKGRTNADGLVSFPTELLSVGAELSLTASKGRRGAVISLEKEFALYRAMGHNLSFYKGDIERTLYTDKPIYRHGETVYFRLYGNEGAPREPLVLALRRGGAALQRWTVELDDYAGYSGSVKLPDEGIDWGYELAVVGNQQWPIAVAEHVAPRVQTDLEMPDGAWVMGSSVPLSVRLRRMSGEPLAGERVRLLGKLEDGGWDMLGEHFPGYSFIDQSNRWTTISLRQRCQSYGSNILYVEFDPTSSEGFASSSLDVPSMECDFGTARIAVTPSIELPGTALSSQREVLITKHPTYLGLAGLQNRWLQIGSQLDLRAIAVDTRTLGRLLPVHASISVERTGDFVLGSVDGTTEPEAGKSDPSDEVNVVHHCELETDGSDSCVWTTTQSGRFSLRLSAPTFADREFRFVVSEGLVYPMPERTELSADQFRYEHGQPVEFSFTHNAQQGQALLLLSDDQGVREQHWYSLQPRRNQITWQPEASWQGSVRATVLIVPAGARGPLPSVAYQTTQFSIDAPPAQLFEIEVPDQATPGSEVVVRLRNTADGAISLTLTAYDDALSGILSEAMEQRQIDRWWRHRPEDFPALPRLHSVLWSNGTVYASLDTDSSLVTVEVTGGSPTSELDRLREAQSDLDWSQRDDWSVINAQNLPAGLRQRFASRFWWAPNEELAAGESRAFRVRLPDDLTRWRIEAVARLKAGPIQQRVATIEARQPLALEAKAPKFLYPGDQSVLAAGLYCAVENPPTLDWRIEVPQLQASGQRLLSPQPNQHAELSLAITPQAPGRHLWWTQARSVDGSQPLTDGLLSSVQVRDPMATATMRQIGLVAADGLSLQPERLLKQAGSGELSLSVGMDPLFGLSGVVREGLARDPWMPDNALEQLLTAVLAQKLGLETDPTARLGRVEAMLIKHHDYQGWVPFPGYSDYGDRALSRRILLGLAELQALGLQVSVPSTVEFERHWEAAELEYLPTSTRLARQMTARRLRGDDAEERLIELLAEAHWTVEASARIALALADSDDHQQHQSKAIAALRDYFTQPVNAPFVGSDLPQTAERCLVLRALNAADQADDAQAIQLKALRDLYSPWGGTVPLLDPQSIRQCVQAAQAFAQRWMQDQPSLVAIGLGEEKLSAEVAYGGAPAQLTHAWNSDESMPIRIAPPQSPLLSYEIAYQREIDLRTAPAEGVAIQIERHYRLFRDGEWLESGTPMAVGDWVQVELRIRAAKPVSYVAVTEALPGALVVVEPGLDNAVDPRLYGETESTWGSRELGDDQNRFMAEGLPTGLTKLHYLARARFPGDYAWPGPQIVLIYAPQVSASGSAERLVVAEKGAVSVEP